MFNNLKAEMKRHNHKTADIARLLNVSYLTAHRKLCGKRSFRVNEVLRLEEVYKVPIKTLFEKGD